MKNILITGGAGFIGSHICLEFLAQQKNVFIIDSFINSNKDVFDGIKKIHWHLYHHQLSINLSWHLEYLLD